jgi:hypothetical protein
MSTVIDYVEPASDQKNSEEMKAKPWTKALTEKLKKNWEKFVEKSTSQVRLQGGGKLGDV